MFLRIVALVGCLIMFNSCAPSIAEKTPTDDMIKTINYIGNIYEIEFINSEGCAAICLISTNTGHSYLIKYPDVELLSFGYEVYKVEYMEYVDDLTEAIVINHIQFTKNTFGYDCGISYEQSEQVQKVLDAVK